MTRARGSLASRLARVEGQRRGGGAVVVLVDDPGDPEAVALAIAKADPAGRARTIVVLPRVLDPDEWQRRAAAWAASRASPRHPPVDEPPPANPAGSATLH